MYWFPLMPLKEFNLPSSNGFPCFTFYLEYFLHHLHLYVFITIVQKLISRVAKLAFLPFVVLFVLRVLSLGELLIAKRASFYNPEHEGFQ